MIFEKEKRVLGEEEVKSLLSSIRRFSNLKDLTSKSVYDALELILKIEHSISGRFAGDIVDYIILYWMARHACRKANENGNRKVSFIETGSLFGASTILLRCAVDSEGMDGTITAIDPMDGYYLHTGKSYSNKIDSSTKLEVNEKRFWDNVNSIGESRIEIKLLKCLSQSKAAIDYSKKQYYDLCFIDGDHSKTGLQNDINIHASRLKRNGVLVVDNVFDRNWPEVSLGLYEDGKIEKRFTPKIFGARAVVLLKQNDGSGKIDRNLYSDMMMRMSNELWESRRSVELLLRKCEIYKEEYSDKIALLNEEFKKLDNIISNLD
jgi:predicted O-methyltransferase YrrM